MATPPKPSDAPPADAPSAVEYAYMYEKNKSPTKQLDALLRAICRHVVKEIGEKDVAQLTPGKLAAFYKAVGGDYDSLFVEMPHTSISYVWQVTGCQHTLQPTEDDFAPPSIPALTPRGFSRWESLEILLGPEEHVPFMQFAVKNWSLKHPDTGELFPPDLPKEVFPTEPDADVDRWHKSCADKLRKEAASSKEKEDAEKAEKAEKAGASPEQSEPKFAYVHVRTPFQSTRPKAPEPPPFERPVSYIHVPGPGRHGGHPGSQRPGKSPDRYAREARESAAEEHARRKSFSDYNSPPNEPSPYAYGTPHLDPNPKRSAEPRRHNSQPRHYSSDSSDDVPPPRMKRRHPPSPPSPPSVRRFVPPPDTKPPPTYRHRPGSRSDDQRRSNGHSPLGSLREKLSEKVSNILPGGMSPERPRNHTRHNSYNNAEQVRPRKGREQAPPSRLSRSYSDLDSDSDTDAQSSDEELRRRKIRQERERDRYRDRGRQRELDREREREREEEQRREHYLRRPDVQRRTSSHADIDRRREYAWDPRNREALREERRRWDRRSSGERGESPMTGVTGRRYPEPAYG